MDPDRDRIDRILQRLELLRAGVHELDRLHASVRAELNGVDEDAPEPVWAD